MNLSRTESRRRLPVMTPARWAAAAVTILVAAVMSAVLYFRGVDAEYREEEERAIRLAIEQGGLVQADRAVSYTWDETMWIVIGKDQEGQDWIVWERADGLEKRKISDGYSEARIRERFAAERPSARPIRVLPGWFEGRPVWEIRYERTPGSDQQGIDFYSFEDGTLLQTYDLPE